MHRITKFVTNIISFLNNRICTWLQDSTNYFSTTTKALTLSVKQPWWHEACSVYQLVMIFSETVSYHQLLRTARVTVPKTMQINCKTLLHVLAIKTSYLMGLQNQMWHYQCTSSICGCIYEYTSSIHSMYTSTDFQTVKNPVPLSLSYTGRSNSIIK